MSDQRGRGRGRGGGGGANSSGRPAAGGAAADKPKRDPILDLSKFVDKKVRVKFTAGREVVGTLKGFDQLLNLVMDDIEESLLDPDSGLPFSPPKSRSLGLAVLRGPSIVVINPVDGSGEIANPFQGDN